MIWELAYWTLVCWGKKFGIIETFILNLFWKHLQYPFLYKTLFLALLSCSSTKKASVTNLLASKLTVDDSCHCRLINLFADLLFPDNPGTIKYITLQSGRCSYPERNQSCLCDDKLSHHISLATCCMKTSWF